MLIIVWDGTSVLARPFRMACRAGRCFALGAILSTGVSHCSRLSLGFAVTFDVGFPLDDGCSVPVSGRFLRTSMGLWLSVHLGTP